MNRILKSSVYTLLISLLMLSTACKEETGTSLLQAEIDDIILQEYFQDNQISPTKTASGIYYEELEIGTGIVPASGDIISLHYQGNFLYGDIFDSSYFKGEPFIIEQGTGRTVDEFDENGSPVFGSGGVIAGWQEITQIMSIGQKLRVYIPSELAYGTRGNQGISPNAILVFEMELLEILQ